MTAMQMVLAVVLLLVAVRVAGLVLALLAELRRWVLGAIGLILAAALVAELLT
ncbi:MAG: hypothetical protein Q4D96_03630 [Propionibacteriaceae bacterium]|nr:hypothetical protein [Propionibacteriaceae bacterium]